METATKYLAEPPPLELSKMTVGYAARDYAVFVSIMESGSLQLSKKATLTVHEAHRCQRMRSANHPAGRSYKSESETPAATKTRGEWRGGGGEELRPKLKPSAEMGNGDDESNRHSNALDLDMDLGDLAPTRKPSRFQPKFKPKAKSKAKEEGEAEQPPPPSIPVLRKEVEEEDGKKGSVRILKQVKSEKSEVVEEKPVVSLDALQDTKGEKIEKVDPVAEAAVKDEVCEEAMDVDAGFDMDGDDEDAVVREIDVFFSPLSDENTQLYVMQYPLRPCWRPYEFADRCQEIRVNPKESKLEIDLEMNIGTDNSREDEDIPEQLRQQKQTLTSSKAPTVTSYAVGILMGSKLRFGALGVCHSTIGVPRWDEAVSNCFGRQYFYNLFGVLDFVQKYYSSQTIQACILFKSIRVTARNKNQVSQSSTRNIASHVSPKTVTSGNSSLMLASRLPGLTARLWLGPFHGPVLRAVLPGSSAGIFLYWVANWGWVALTHKLALG
ncbi:hypothetical protein ACLOJK_038396 [Asimina triloba]